MPKGLKELPETILYGQYVIGGKIGDSQQTVRPAGRGDRFYNERERENGSNTIRSVADIV